MKTVNDILEKQRLIVSEAENKWIDEDEYYKNIKESSNKWAYKYGRVTFNLADQILQLQKQINNLKN